LYKILANTLLLGKNVVFVPECHSTNTLLQDLAQKTSSTEGTVVITNKQTHGRGQRGSGWEAEEGKNLTLSLLLKPSFLAAQDQFYLTIVASLGVYDFLSAKSLSQVKIKWPNDVMVNEKKIAGILIENSLLNSTIQQSIVGIGLNVNQKLFSMPTATSLSQEAKKEFDLSIELNLLIEAIEKRYLQLRAGKTAEMKDEYLKNLYWIGKEHLFKIKDKEQKGIIQGIDRAGRLEVSCAGTIDHFGLKEISFLQ
jgi:BirA family transcriptional regulator, biotin operon repressor / biotin---[acetyl-CoA-carboxylase] ligase